MFSTDVLPLRQFQNETSALAVGQFPYFDSLITKIRDLFEITPTVSQEIVSPITISEIIAEAQESYILTRAIEENNSDFIDELFSITEELLTYEKESGKPSDVFYQNWIAGNEQDTFENNMWAILYEARVRLLSY